MKKNLKQVRHCIEWFLIKCIKFGAPIIPRTLIVELSKFIGRLAFVFDNRGRLTGMANAKCAIDSNEITSYKTRQIIIKSYEFFSRSAIDLFWGRNLNKNNYSDFIQFEFEDKDAHERATKQGAIWITPHYGNFEWLSLAMGFRGTPLTVIAQDFRNPLLTNIFKTAREHSGNEIISSKKAVIKLLKTLKRGGNTALLTDLNVKPSRDAIPIKCFSKITSVTRLHVFLHQKTGLPIIPAISLPCSDGSYLMKILKPIELSSTSTEKQIAQKCWDVFIPFMSQFPEPWLWMYRHWRYLPQKEDSESYPFYAESSEKFEVWLRENS